VDVAVLVDNFRDCEVFLKPEKFDPEWFGIGNNDRSACPFVPFSIGIRNCIDINYEV